ncbi:MAG: hypothetical protein LJE83_02325 [Gammaproteobacteria bacterium]|jgi:hypothetical protein|nr:hypothetical protein [Gammaproteobacteria bacterium]
MKIFSIYNLLALLLVSVSTSVMAHPGHMANENLHGFLHAEHIIMFAVVGLTVYLIKLFGNK